MSLTPRRLEFSTSKLIGHRVALSSLSRAAYVLFLFAKAGMSVSLRGPKVLNTLSSSAKMMTLDSYR